MPWDWLVLDMGYVLVLLGGTMIFRARGTSAGGWVWFGAFAASVGTILMIGTWQAQAAFAQAAALSDAITTLKAAC